MSRLASSLRSALSAVPAWAGVSAALVVGGAIGAWLNSVRAIKSQPEDVYVLVVRIKLRPGRSADEFFAQWAPYARVVYDTEPRCLTYKAVVAEDDPQSIILYERYAHKNDLIETHQKTEDFKSFGKALKSMDIVLEFQSAAYIEASPGFHARAEGAAPPSYVPSTA